MQTKNVNRKIYQFVVFPPNIKINVGLAILNVADFTAEDAIEKAKVSLPKHNLILVGHQDEQVFLDSLNMQRTIIEEIEKEPIDYSQKTQEEIDRLILYLKDKGYTIKKPKII